MVALLTRLGMFGLFVHENHHQDLVIIVCSVATFTVESSRVESSRVGLSFLTIIFEPLLCRLFKPKSPHVQLGANT